MFPHRYFISGNAAHNGTAIKVGGNIGGADKAIAYTNPYRLEAHGEKKSVSIPGGTGPCLARTFSEYAYGTGAFQRTARVKISQKNHGPFQVGDNATANGRSDIESLIIRKRFREFSQAVRTAALMKHVGSIRKNLRYGNFAAFLNFGFKLFDGGKVHGAFLKVYYYACLGIGAVNFVYFFYHLMGYGSQRNIF